MTTHTNKAPAAKGHAVANNVSQPLERDGQGIQFIDKRPESDSFQKLKALAANSDQVQQLAAWKSVLKGQPRPKPSLQLKSGQYASDKSSLTEKNVIKSQPLVQRKENKPGMINQFPDGGKGVIQRLSLIIGDISGIDKITSEDIAVTTKIAGGEIKPLTSIDDKNTEIENGEIIALIGHGEVGKIEGISADDISEYLLKIKNISNAKVIYVSSCMSSVGDKPNEATEVSTINKIVTNLRKKKVTVAAIGFEGSAIHQFDESGELAPDVVVNPKADMKEAFKWQAEIAKQEGFDLKSTGSLFGEGATIDLESVYQDIGKSRKFYKRLSGKFNELGILLPSDKSMRLINTDGSGFMLTPAQALEFLLSR